MVSAAVGAGAVAPAPPAGVWEIDPTHSNVEFVVRHFFTSVRGRFGQFSGQLVLGDRPEEARVEATIAAASIDTSLAPRDGHLRGPDFLDADRFPELRFRGLSVRPRGDGRWAVAGELTIRDVTRPVVLDVEFRGWTPDPWGGQRAGFSARAEVDRQEYGMGWNVAIETGGVVLGRTVRIEIEAELIRRAEEAA